MEKSCATCGRGERCTREKVLCPNYKAEKHRPVCLSVKDFAAEYNGTVSIQRMFLVDEKPWDEYTEVCEYSVPVVTIRLRAGATAKYGCFPGLITPMSRGETMHESWKATLVSSCVRKNGPC